MVKRQQNQEAGGDEKLIIDFLWPNCSPLFMSIVVWFLYRPSKKLVFMPVASATAGGHRNYPVLVSVAQWPEIQPLASRGQLVSADLP